MRLAGDFDLALEVYEGEFDSWEDREMLSRKVEKGLLIDRVIAEMEVKLPGVGTTHWLNHLRSCLNNHLDGCVGLWT